MFKTRKLKPRKPTLADFFQDASSMSLEDVRARYGDTTNGSARPDENVAATIASVSIINS